MTDLVTISGTFLTAIGTGVTLWQAHKVKKYREQIAFDLRKIYISEAGEQLRRAQEDCRRLLKINGRGQSIPNLCDGIQERIDNALNRFNQKDSDDDIKSKITEAHSELHTIRQSGQGGEEANTLHVCLQQAISLCNERVSEIN